MAATNSYEIAGESSAHHLGCLVQCTDWFTVVQVTGLPQVRLGQSLNTHVQVDTPSVSSRTRDEQWINAGSVRWDGKITL